LGVDGEVWESLVDGHVIWTFSRLIWPVRRGQNTETPTPRNIEQVRVVICFLCVGVGACSSCVVVAMHGVLIAR
jgi:hypothetical protein